MEIKVGLKGTAETFVTTANTAKSMGSGLLEVFATPAMIALMEEAAVNALELPEHQSSVGISLNVQHTAATPLGMKVQAEAELVEIDRRRLVFSVRAFDEAGEIGHGQHERFIVDIEKFMDKAQNRKKES